MCLQVRSAKLLLCNKSWLDAQRFRNSCSTSIFDTSLAPTTSWTLPKLFRERNLSLVVCLPKKAIYAIMKGLASSKSLSILHDTYPFFWMIIGRNHAISTIFFLFFFQGIIKKRKSKPLWNQSILMSHIERELQRPAENCTQI